MLIIALVLAVIGLASLVAAVVTSNELIAWVCIGASVIGVLLLIVDALRDRSRRHAEDADEPVEPEARPESAVQDYPDDDVVEAPEATDASDEAEPATEVPEVTEASGADPGTDPEASAAKDADKS